MVKESQVEEFAGKIAVITGATSRLGRALADCLAREGMRIVLADLDQNSLDRAVAALREQHCEVVGVRTDVSQLASVQGLARRTLEAYGRVHLVCNNPGVDSYRQGAIWEESDRDWLWAFGVNFWGVVHAARTFVPIMLAQNEDGHIVNTASTSGQVRSGDVDGITKHAVVALTETMHSQLAQHETRLAVSVLCPGVAHTRGQVDKRASASMPPAEVAEVVLQAVRDRQLYVVAGTRPGGSRGPLKDPEAWLRAPSDGG